MHIQFKRELESRFEEITQDVARSEWDFYSK